MDQQSTANHRTQNNQQILGAWGKNSTSRESLTPKLIFSTKKWTEKVNEKLADAMEVESEGEAVVRAIAHKETEKAKDKQNLSKTLS